MSVSSVRRHFWPALILLVYLGLGTAFSVANPLHEATDEIRHYRYVRYIADYGMLPVQSGEQGNAQAHHPPLYYLTAALATFWVHPNNPLYEPLPNPHWAFRDWEVGVDNKNQYLHGPDEVWPYRDTSLAAHLSRWVTLIWGGGAVLFTYMIAHTLLPDRPAVASTAMALVAFGPMYAYLSGAINNDVPATLASAAITYACVRLTQDGLNKRRALILGILYGLANLTKFNLIAMLAVIELALLLAPTQGKRWSAFLQANAFILGATIVLAGWWYTRNTILYGEPTGFIRLTEIWGLREPDVGIALIGPQLRDAWTTLWGRFGYGQIPLPQMFYQGFGVLCGLGLIGLAVLLIRARLRAAQSLTGAQWRMVAILAAAVMVNFAVLCGYILISPFGAMGRFLFPGLPAFATLVAAGLVGLWPKLAQVGVAISIAVTMLTATLVALIGYLMPAYAIPVEATPPSEPLNITFGGAIRVLDYHISPTAVRPGGQVNVTVTWQVIRPTNIPYAVFVHLVDSQGILIAQRDTYTGLGNYPSMWWRPGHTFTETYRLFLPETAYVPEQAHIELGLYNPDAGRLPIDELDTPDNALTIGHVAVEADPTAVYPNQTFVNWEDRFALLGYTIEPRTLTAGQQMVVTLYWQAITPPVDEDFKVFLHVLDDQQAVWGSYDGPPVGASMRTSGWNTGDIYEDVRTLILRPDTPPGLYTIELGWFSDVNGERLNVVANDGHIIDNRLLLGTVRVVAIEQ
jgi:hypothetical protein